MARIQLTIGVLLGQLSLAASAATYDVVELQPKPLLKDAYTQAVARTLSKRGEVLMSVESWDNEGNARGGGQVCSAAGTLCKPLRPRDAQFVIYWGASGDFRYFVGTASADNTYWGIRTSGTNVEYFAERADVFGVNRQGLSVGTMDGGHTAFAYGTHLTALPGLGNEYNGANAVNDAGLIVGESRSSEWGDRAVYWWNGAVKLAQTDIPLDRPGFHSKATAVTAKGVIYGDSDYTDKQQGKTRAVRFTADGRAIDLGALLPEHGNSSNLFAVGNNGLAGGLSTKIPEDFFGVHAVLFDGTGVAIEVATLVSEEARQKYDFQSVRGINAAGQLLVAGKLKDSGGDFVVLRLDPVPTR